MRCDAAFYRSLFDDQGALRSDAVALVDAIYSSGGGSDAKKLLMELTTTMLDLGVSYFQAKQQGYRTYAAVERRRKVIDDIVKSTQEAYWKAVAADRLLPRLKPLLAEADKMLENSREASRQKLVPQLQGLDYQQNMLSVVGQLRRMQTDLNTARVQLASLIDVPTDAPIQFAPMDLDLSTSPAKVDPRKLIFLGVMWLAFVTFMRSLGNTDMSFGSIAIWIFLAGAGMPFFFMPLISISMGAVRPEEMGDVEFSVGRRAAERALQLIHVAAGEGASHGRARRRIAAQLHDRVAHARIADVVATRIGVVADRVGVAAVAEPRPGRFHGGEPRLLDELEQPLGRRGRGLGRGIEVRFELRGGEQIVEARAGRARSLPDRSGGLSTRALRCRTRTGGIDRHR